MGILMLIILVSASYVVESVSLLRPDDLGRPGVLIHYHRDASSGKHTRHIHYLPVKRSHGSQQKNSFFNDNSKEVNPAAVYEVPSQKHFNERHEAELSLNLRTLLDSQMISNNNSSKSNSSSGGSTSRNAGVYKKHDLPHGLQFLKSRKIGTNEPLNKNKTSGPRYRPGFLRDQTTTKLSKNDGHNSRGVTKNIAKLLSNSKTNDHSSSRSPGNLQAVAVDRNSSKNYDQSEPMLANLFMGLFKQTKGMEERRKAIMNESTTIGPHTRQPRGFYQKSTTHARPITKRGAIDTEQNKSIMDHILRIKIRNTTPLPNLERITTATRYGGAASSKSLNKHYEPLSGIDLVNVRQQNRNRQHMPAAVKASLNHKPVSSKELVHLKGIHVMFSNGKQNKSKTIPTLHLTATVSDNARHMSSSSTSLKADSTNGEQTSKPNSQNILDKIVGTAIIRNGQLYLVLYPFSDNKKFELHYAKANDQSKLPRNKPVPFASTQKLVKTTTAEPSSTTTTPVPTTTKDHIDLASLLAGLNLPDLSATDHSAHDHHGAEHGGAHGDLGHHHHHQHHHGHMAAFGDLSLSEVNETALHQILTPVKRFMSPWKSLNFSNVSPHPNTKGNSSKLSEEEDIEIVTFTANATDPFDKIKVILESLSNASTNNSNKNMATFNFEVKLKTKSLKTPVGTTPSTKTTDNNSEEVTIDMGLKVTTQTPSTGFDSTEPLMKSTQMPNADNEMFGQNSVNMNDASAAKTSENRNGEILKNKAESSTVEGLRQFDTVTSIPSMTMTPDMYDSISPSVTSSFKPYESVTRSSVKKSEFTKEVANSDGETITISTPPAETVQTTDKPPRTTFTYFPSYTASSKLHQQNYNGQPQPFSSVGSRSRSNQHTETQTSKQNKPVSPSGREEQTISLAEILIDIKKFQLHNTREFSARNNNIDTRFIDKLQQSRRLHTPILVEAPVYSESSTRYSDIPMMQRQYGNRMNNFVTPDPVFARIQWRRDQERADLRRALDAMLVLSVDDILADHTSLHGALVMSQRRDSSSSNNK